MLPPECVPQSGPLARMVGLPQMERDHEVTVLEASRRVGGHVKTIREPLPDGLYADVGAEHFTKPGYTMYWKYVEKFNQSQ